MGYNTCTETQASTANNLYSMMALPFEKVDGKGLSLNDLQFSNGKSGRSTAADHIKLWVMMPSGSFDYEDWYNAGGTTGWKATSGGASFDEAYSDGLPAGTVFWYIATKRADAGNVTVSGAVVSDESVTKTITRGQYNFVSYPYPVALKLNDKTQVDWGNAASGRSTAADHIKLWVYNESTGAYDYEDWYNAGATGWKATSGGATFESKHPNGVVVGTGFWYSAYNKAGLSETFDITFKSPLAKAAE